MKNSLLLIPVVLLFGLMGCRLFSPGPMTRPTPTATLAPDGSNFVAETLAPGRAVFLHRIVSVQGQCVSGECSPGPSIGSPAYSWDGPNHRLEIYQPGFELEQNTKILYGDGMTLSGLSGGGMTQQISQLYAVPMTMPGEITLMRLDPDGTVYFAARAERVLMRPGENYCATYSETKYQGPGQIQNTIMDCISNFGIIGQNDLVRH